MGLSSMNYGGVRAPLFLTILVMAVVPLCAAFYLLDRAVATSLDLGFNGSVVHALDDSSRNLKTLKRLIRASRMNTVASSNRSSVCSACTRIRAR